MLFAAVLMLFAGEVSAQNKAKQKTAKPSSQTAKSEKPQLFLGTITYVVEKQAVKPTGDRPDLSNDDKRMNLNNQAPSQVAAPHSAIEELPNYAVYEDSYSLSQMMGLYRYYEGDGMLYRTAFSAFDSPRIFCEMPLCMAAKGYCEYLEELNNMQREGDLESANELLKKIYTRTQETKKLAGYEVVRYDVKLNDVRGSIWVAEELLIKNWQPPFWGLNHPVLEYDFFYPANDKEPIFIHLVANKVEASKENDKFFKEFDKVMHNADPMDPMEFVNVMNNILDEMKH